HRAVGRAKPPARHFDVAQVLRGVPAVRLSSAGNGASFSAFRQRTRVRLLPALRFGLGETRLSLGEAQPAAQLAEPSSHRAYGVVTMRNRATSSRDNSILRRVA
ncbi:MAG: hypothetical protein V7604_2404, partial [Hyphomicrobiales bacterium]